ncbi:MAG: DUF1080 domain-containing protein [Planctomycetota bacterium]|nr:DUF1080 domain-containing protein [Planctomycetota bacterium]
MKWMTMSAAGLLVMCGMAWAADRPLNQPPEGFANLFEGKDLGGWRGRQQDYSPYEEMKLTKEELAGKQVKWNEDMKKHWRVDAAKGEIVSDGQGVYLTTGKDYGDFEFCVDWLMVQKNGDSGIYLRGVPQVQIWDRENPGVKDAGAPRGSGALWNNNNDNPGKWPLVTADNPVGQWNTMRIKMIGSRVWVWLNDKVTVDGQIMDNYFDPNRKLAVLPTGPIELQTHGSEMRFRNVFVREIGAEEANKALDKVASEGFKSVFNGRDFEGWDGPVGEYQVKDGAIMCQKGKGGTIYVKEEYGDFEAKLEFLLPPGGNNGLAIRYPGKGDTAYAGMCELQILDDTAAQYKGLDPRQYCGSVYGVVPVQRGYLRAVGQWNFERVTVKGSTIKVELNGNVVINADVSKVKEYMSNSAHPGLTRTKGYFGFAGHSDPVVFRNVQIKKLD